jgi:uncharacterized protein (DUF305 family)
MKIIALLLVVFVAAGCAKHDVVHVGHNDYLADHANHVHHQVVSEESFIADMIPHHQEAVDTSARLHAITQDPVLKELTQAIVDGQATEIAMMQSWLDAWYPDSTYVSTYTPMMRDTSTISAISTIEKFWIEDMIQHHMGAVMMAEDVFKLNPRNEVDDFARDVIAVQTDEILLMQQLLQNY